LPRVLAPAPRALRPGQQCKRYGWRNAVSEYIRVAARRDISLLLTNVGELVERCFRGALIFRIDVAKGRTLPVTTPHDVGNHIARVRLAATPTSQPLSHLFHHERNKFRERAASYEDWTVRCDLKSGPPPEKICQIIQSVRTQSQANPISQIAVGRAAKGQALKALVQVPISVWLPAGVTVVFDEKEAALVLTFAPRLDG
jgi:hypothetical protein